MYGKSGPVIRRPLYFTHNLSDAKDRGEYRAVAGAITEALTRRARAGIVGAVAGSIDWPTGNVVSLVAPMALLSSNMCLAPRASRRSDSSVVMRRPR